jgi:RNA polymerase sigma factor (sigma-70 family)
MHRDDATRAEHLRGPASATAHRRPAPDPGPRPALPRRRPCTTAGLPASEEHWRGLVQRCSPALRRIAGGHRLRDHDVEDVVQSCWLALLEDGHRLRDPAAAPGWLATAARRQALRTRRRGHRDVLSAAPADELPAPECTETGAVEGERAAALHAAVRRLPEHQRTLLEALLGSPDHSYAEISRRLGLPHGSIGPTRARAIERLRADPGLQQVTGG